MSENGATSILPQTFVECGLCTGNFNISWFCKNCTSSLCDTCATDHKTSKQYKTHVVLPRTYTILRLYGPAKLAVQCSIHPEKEISSYCDECDIPCCISCLANNHKLHNFSTIEDKYLGAEKRLNEYYRQLNTEFRPTLITMRKQAESDVREDRMNSEKVIDDIQIFHKDVVHNFNRACDGLIAHSRNQSRKLSLENIERLKKIEDSIKTLESIKTELEEKIAKGNFDLIRYIPPEIKTLVPKSNEPKRIIPIFSPASKLLDVIHEVGMVELEEIQECDNIDTYAVHIQKKKSFESRTEATSLTSAGVNGAWIMSFFSPMIHKYNDSGEEVLSVDVNGSGGIHSMVIGPHGDIIVSCADKKVRCLRSWDEFRPFSRDLSILIDTEPFSCYGVCLNDKAEILLCKSGQGDKNHLGVYSSTGRTLIREIRSVDEKGNRFITDPHSVVQNCENIYVVNECKDVVCVDEKGDMRWVYNGDQVRLKEAFCPRCLCIDKYHNLLVTDSNNNMVHYISREGVIIKMILSQDQTGLTSHFGIFVDDFTGHVWIGNEWKDVVIAKYLK